jgi:hypothetical protein
MYAISQGRFLESSSLRGFESCANHKGSKTPRKAPKRYLGFLCGSPLHELNLALRSLGAMQP